MSPNPLNRGVSVDYTKTATSMETSNSRDDSVKRQVQLQHLIDGYCCSGGAVTLAQLEELERCEGGPHLDVNAHLTLGFDLYVIRDNRVCTTSWPGFAAVQAGLAFWTEVDAVYALFLITAKSQISPITEAQWQHLRPGTPVFIITVADGMATGVNESQVTHADALDHCQQCWHQLKGRAFFTIVAAHATWLLQCQAQTLPVTVEQAHSLHPGDVLYQNSPCHTEPFTWVSWSQQKRRIKRGNCFFTRTAAVAAYDATRPQADGETARQARVASYRTSTLPMTKAEAQDLRYGMDIWTISATGEPQPLQIVWPECPNHMPDSFTNLLLSRKLFWSKDTALCYCLSSAWYLAPIPVATETVDTDTAPALVNELTHKSTALVAVTQHLDTARPYADLKGTAVMEQLMLSIGARVEAASRGEAFDATGQRDMAIEICRRLEALEAIAVPYVTLRQELTTCARDRDQALALLRTAFAYAQAVAVAEAAANDGVVTPASVNMQTQLHDFITSRNGFDEE